LPERESPRKFDLEADYPASFPDQPIEGHILIITAINKMNNERAAEIKILFPDTQPKYAVVDDIKVLAKSGYKELFKTLLKTYITSNNEMEVFINNMEASLIEKFRPYINHTILKINNKLQSLNKKLGIFVAGGDATRRYKNDISVTKDIDTKIYIPSDLASDKPRIEKIVIKKLLKLCSFLIDNRSSLFNKIAFPYPLNHMSSDDEYDYNASFIINETDDPNLLNFRFRQIFKGIFPVDLLSLDYRCKIVFNVKHKSSQKEFEFIYKYDIAFLDVVLETLNAPDNYYEKYSVLSNGLPVCGLAFLLKDLQNTYNSDASSLLRFLGNKNNKDFDRYIALNVILNDENFIFKSNREIIETQKYTSNTRKRALLDNIEPFKTNKEPNSTFNLIKTSYLSIVKEREDKQGKSRAKNKAKIALSYNKEELFKDLGVVQQFGGAFANINIGIGKMNLNDTYQDYILFDDYDNSRYEITTNDYIDNSNISDDDKYDVLKYYIPNYDYDDEIFNKYYNENKDFFSNKDKVNIIEFSA
jgi:hypothetical protein